MATVNVDLRPTTNLLIVEDDIHLAKFLERHLSSEGYFPTIVHDGEVGLDLLARKPFDLAVLDLNLPGLDGMSLLRRVRPEKPKLPIMVLTGRGRTEDRVLSLDTGADDCLVKPFSLVEFSARVRALLRRNSSPIENESQVADLRLLRDEWKVERAGKRIELTTTEFKLLEYLMRNAGRPVSRAELMENIWKQTYDPSSNLVDVYVKYVRDKVDSDSDLKLIRTMRGLGYVLSADERSS
jgi:DNA-binding response OmpR family regulator